MTRKDLELIARVLKARKPETWEGSAWVGIVRDMADELEDTDPRFNRSVFLKACGYAN